MDIFCFVIYKTVKNYNPIVWIIKNNKKIIYTFIESDEPKYKHGVIAVKRKQRVSQVKLNHDVGYVNNYYPCFLGEKLFVLINNDTGYI